jgi:hypothetical protein
MHPAGCLPRIGSDVRLGERKQLTQHVLFVLTARC